MNETWRDVPGYEGLYEVSDLGVVRSIRRPGTRGTILAQAIGIRGYLGVFLYRDGARKHVSVHSLVAQAFHGPRPEGGECRHLNGTRMDNRASNLKWGTPAENGHDKTLHGRTNSRVKQCPHGHHYDEKNTYRWNGKRYCRTCSREQGRRYQKNVRARKRLQNA